MQVRAHVKSLTHFPLLEDLYVASCDAPFPPTLQHIWLSEQRITPAMLPSLSLCRNLQSFGAKGAVHSDIFNPSTFPRLESLTCSCTTESEVVNLCSVIRAYDNNIDVEADICIDSAGRGICAIMNDPLVQGVNFGTLDVQISTQDILSHSESGLPYPWQGRRVNLLRMQIEGTQLPPLSTLEGISCVDLVSSQQDQSVPPCELLLDGRLLRGVDSFTLQKVDLARVSFIRLVGAWSIRNDCEFNGSWSFYFSPSIWGTTG